MTADDSKPPVGGGPTGPTREDGYSETFQEAIAESAFFVQQGLLNEAVGVLEELQRIHGDDPRIMGRLHMVRKKLAQAQEGAAPAQPPAAVQAKPKPQPKPKPKPKPQPKRKLIPPPAKAGSAVAKPNLTPPPGRPAAAAQPRLTPPPAASKAQPLRNLGVPGAGPPTSVAVPEAPVVDTSAAAPLPPVPEFDSRSSNAITNPVTIPVDLESASAVELTPDPFDEPPSLPGSAAPPPPAPEVPKSPITPLGRAESLEVDLVLEPDEEPAPVAAPILSTPPVLEPAPTPAAPITAPAEAESASSLIAAAAASPAPPATPTGAGDSPLRPFERKRSVLTPDPPSEGGRQRKMFLLIGVAALVIVAAVVVLFVALRGRGERKSKGHDTTATAGMGEEQQRPRSRPRPVRRRAVGAVPSDSMTAMSRGAPEDREPPSRPVAGDEPGDAMAGNDPDPDSGQAMSGDSTGGGDSDRVKIKVRLRLTIEPRRAKAVVYFRGGKYRTNRFVSKKVRSRTSEEVITVKARGYRKLELKLTLDQDLERTVKLRRKARRMKLFDFKSKR